MLDRDDSLYDQIVELGMLPYILINLKYDLMYCNRQNNGLIFDKSLRVIGEIMSGSDTVTQKLIDEPGMMDMLFTILY